MALWKKVLKSWKNQSITIKFGQGVGLLLLLMVLVAATGYVSLAYVCGADNSIRISNEVQRLVLEMDRGMEKARHLQAGFFLYYPKIGLQQAHEDYAQPSVRQAAEVVSISKSLKNMMAQPEVSNAIGTSTVNLNLYLSSAKRFADTSIEAFELVTQLATPETGLEAQLDKYLAALNIELTAENSALNGSFHDLDIFIKKYQLSRERHLMQSAFNVSFRLRQTIEAMPSLPTGQKERVFSLLAQSRNAAEKILAVDVAIKAKFNDFILQDQAASSVSGNLVELARKEVTRSQKVITDTHKWAKIVVFAVTFAGLIAAGFIFRILNTNITRRVLRLTSNAEEIRKGNLEVVADEGAMDEVGKLGHTFNFMAVRIKELIENLEDNVAQRTAELATSERRFRQLFEHSRSGVAVYEPIDNGEDFIFKDINQAVERLEGVKRREVLGRKVTDIFPGVIEFGLLDVFRKVMQTGQSASHPIRLYDDGKLQGWRENSVYKLPSGELVAVYDDRTAEKEAEIQKTDMEKQLQRAKKMEAIGLLAGGVAHDLNNILSGIVGYPELILMELPEESKLRGPITAIHESGKRAAAVVADLLTVARGVASSKTNTNINTLVGEYLESPEGLKLLSLHEHIKCQTKLDPQLQNIYCSPVHIKKCIMNLLTNAMESIDTVGSVIISSSNQQVEEKQAIEKGMQAGEYVVLKVTDTGSGISPQDLEHIFEPFYTKKVMGRSGTGLGLAVVWNSMQDHGGITLVESSSKGTSFHLYFPAVTAELSQEEGQSTEAEAIMGNGEKILIVDDEPQLRNLAKRILEKFAYHTIDVCSGEEAIDYLKHNRVDLVLLDMLMEPGINGRQTYEAIIKIHPKQKAVIASGFSESEDVKKAQQLGAWGFIKKPYSMEQLGRVIKEAIS